VKKIPIDPWFTVSFRVHNEREKGKGERERERERAKARKRRKAISTKTFSKKEKVEANLLLGKVLLRENPSKPCPIAP